jgi:monofunctional biosynthetic peptidoglycan transglycosylase
MATTTKRVTTNVTNRSNRLIFDFSDPPQAEFWLPVNDVVMGGISSGTMAQHSPKSAFFTGVVSLEHGGGFASVRTPPAEYNLSAFTGLTLLFKGDGKRYKLNLTDDQSREGLLFQANFSTTSEEWTEEFFPFDGFIPMFRGRPVLNHPPLRTQVIKSFGLMISGKQSGEFSLEIAAIAAYCSTHSTNTKE